MCRPRLPTASTKDCCSGGHNTRSPGHRARTHADRSVVRPTAEAAHRAQTSPRRRQPSHPPSPPAIRLPANQVLQNRISHLLTWRVDRPPRCRASCSAACSIGSRGCVLQTRLHADARRVQRSRRGSRCARSVSVGCHVKPECPRRGPRSPLTGVKAVLSAAQRVETTLAFEATRAVSRLGGGSGPRSSGKCPLKRGRGVAHSSWSVDRAWPCGPRFPSSSTPRGFSPPRS
jgi:hypothetical protein